MCAYVFIIFLGGVSSLSLHSQQTTFWWRRPSVPAMMKTLIPVTPVQVRFLYIYIYASSTPIVVFFLTFLKLAGMIVSFPFRFLLPGICPHAPQSLTPCFSLSIFPLFTSAYYSLLIHLLFVCFFFPSPFPLPHLYASQIILCKLC